MKRIIAAVLFAFVVAGLVFVHLSKPPSANRSDTGTLRQLSRGWTREHRLESLEFGPVDVKVLGNVAVVHRSITQHFINIKDGQHADFNGAWMDVWEKRGDKWVVVRSQTNLIHG